jgi:transposase-like protein
MGTQSTESEERKKAQSERLMTALGTPDPLTVALRGKVREFIETLVNAELTEMLAAVRYARGPSRQGYRHGSIPRTLTTGLGQTALILPRARLRQGAETIEWRSHLIPRYERRAAAVDAAMLGCYLGGANSRRIKGALAPLLRGAPLSKSAVSRLVGQVNALYDRWHRRDLKEEAMVILYLDALAVRVRLDRKVVSVPVLVALGVRPDGQKVVLDLEMLTSESTTAWSGFLESLVARGLTRPQLCVLDGNPGLRAAVETSWPGIAVQRCVVHKLRNLERHAPQHAREELTADYHRITEAESGNLARQAYHSFLAKWDKRLPKVTASLREAGEELLTFYRLPPSQWKCVRSTNAIERLNEEFRRRVKTQGALPTAQTVEVLFYGLLVTGQIRMRRIDGWRQLPAIPAALTTTVAA